MQYAFVLGRVYTLSLAEVITVLTQYELNRPASLAKLNIKITTLSPEILIIDSDAPFDVTSIQKTLGGCIKIIKILETVPRKQTDSIYFSLQNFFSASRLKKEYLSGTGKIQFGVSIYLLDLTVKAFGEPKKTWDAHKTSNAKWR
jgi:hypothetical protein